MKTSPALRPSRRRVLALSLGVHWEPGEGSARDYVIRAVDPDRAVSLRPLRGQILHRSLSGRRRRC